MSDVDERRARALYKRTCEINRTPFAWPPFEHGTEFWLDMARAIRESDRAAGYALVPRAATEKMRRKLNCGMWGCKLNAAIAAGDVSGGE